MEPDLLIVVGSGGTVVRQVMSVAPSLGWVAHQIDERAPEMRSTVMNDGAQVFVALEDRYDGARLITELREAGVTLATLVHPTAWVNPSASLGHNVMIGPQCVVEMDAVVGDGVVQSALGSIEHDNVIGAHVFLGTGAILCGRVTLGEHAFIGGGVVIKPGISIGERTTVGTGAVVVKDVGPDQTVVGNPARPL